MNKYFKILGLLIITASTFAMNKKNKKTRSRPTTISTSKKSPGWYKLSKAEKEYFANVGEDFKTTDDVTKIQGPILPHPNMPKATAYEMQLINATIAKSLSLVKDAIENHHVNVNVAPCQGVAALHLASTNGCLDIVKYLVEKGANVNAKDDEGYTPLVYALSAQNKDIVNYLKTQGATE